MPIALPLTFPVGHGLSKKLDDPLVRICVFEEIFMFNPILNVLLVKHMVKFIGEYVVDPLELKVLGVCHDEGGVRKNATNVVQVVQELDLVPVEHNPCRVHQDVAHLLLRLLLVPANQSVSFLTQTLL